jgi:ribonuclease BN (tRNA processing enzyme)
LDAGSLGFYRAPNEQACIKHIVISHTHIDHLASLPMFLENAYKGQQECVTVHGSVDVLDCLRRDLFNDRIWPDFIRLSELGSPFLKLSLLEEGKPVDLEGLHITPVPVNHAVPTFGFIVQDKAASIIFPSDTGPTQAIWEHANRLPNLKAVFLEATFPNAMTWLANVSKHLTPALFAEEVRKLRRAAALIVVHIKPRFRTQVVRELMKLGLPHLEIARAGIPYQF